MSEATREFFDTLSKVLLRCWIFGFVVLLFWVGAVVFAEDLVYGVHGMLFGLKRSQLTVTHYCGMGLFKLAVACLFFIPWVSIRLVLEKRQ